MTNDETSKLLLAKGIEAKAALADAVAEAKAAMAVAVAKDAIATKAVADAKDAADKAVYAAAKANAATDAYDKVHAEYFESKIVEGTSE
ncbi:MAG: hypothetical protein GY815_15510 [Gammaproteobacteria bacterium]|nr:hypothetical protein [Gammaproteobacteria bacterium]